MKRKRYVLGTAIVIACGVGIFVTSVAASANSPAPSIDRSYSASAQHQFVPASVADYRVALLSNPQRVIDKLPQQFEPSSLSQKGLVVQSTRFLGAESGVAYWLALDNEGLICLVAATDDIAGSGCFTADRFLSGGANVRFSTEKVAVEAYAVSDTAAADPSLQADGVTKVGSNVFVVDTGLSEEIRRDFEVSGSPLRLFPEAMTLGELR